ncbi:BRCT domain-containing protein [Lipomyces arxii]|uniref:BRCT domain-containing protein n=1 Tax=Lipomyces arxii TaxID=56418 RepID=UPI0034CFB799
MMTGTLQPSSPIDTIEKKLALQIKSPIFKSLVYYIVQDDAISREYDKLRQLLNDGGAQEVEIFRDGNSEKWNVKAVTHIITTNIDFPEYDEAEELMINVVKPLWVYKSVSHNRISPIRLYSPNPKLFFSDVNIVVAGLHTGDCEALYGGVRALGGQWSETLSRFTTHVVALSADHPKCKAASHARRAVKVVLPHWIDDCLKLNRRIDDTPYLFPDPKILTDANSGITLTPPNKDLTYLHSAYVREDFKPPEPRSTVFDNKKFFLGLDLRLSERSRSTLQVMIEAAGGQTVENRSDSNVYIGYYRYGPEYVGACRNHLVVGNLTWLYWMVAHDKWSSPMSHLLHYPIPKWGLDEMTEYKICVSGYSGESRHYMEKLILACGAKYTKALRLDNTHLITAKPSGEKYEAARLWNQHIVNHLWLEESYAKWQVQTVTLPRFSHFPRLTNLMEVIGQTRLDASQLKRFYALDDGPSPDRVSQVEDDSSPAKENQSVDVTVPPTVPGFTLSEPVVKTDEVRDSTSKKEPEPVGKVVEKRKLVLKDHNSQQSSVEQQSQHEKVEQEEKPKSSAKENAYVLIAKTVVKPSKILTKIPEPASRARTSSSEDASPPVVSSGGRRAKEKAAEKLRDNIEDLNEYQIQKRRKGLPSLPSEEESQVVATPTRKRKSEESMGIEGASKHKLKTDNKEVTMKVLMTGYPRSLTLHELQRLYRMGIELVEKSHDITHLASPKISRTEKFLCAIPLAPVIISTDFIQDCLTKGKLLNDRDYILRDKEGEKINNCNLSKTLEAAKAKGTGPFKNMVINVTPKAINSDKGSDTLGNIITANGGVVVKIRTPRAKKFAARDGQPMVLISSVEDESYFEAFLDAADAEGRDAYIFTSDWVATGVLRMKVKFGDEFALRTNLNA